MNNDYLSVFKKADGVIEYGDEKNLVLISNNNNDEVLLLNSTAIIIYQMLCSGIKTQEIVNEISKLFSDVCLEQIEEDTKRIVASLIEKGVIKTDE